MNKLILRMPLTLSSIAVRQSNNIRYGYTHFFVKTSRNLEIWDWEQFIEFSLQTHFCPFFCVSLKILQLHRSMRSITIIFFYFQVMKRIKMTQFSMIFLNHPKHQSHLEKAKKKMKKAAIWKTWRWRWSQWWQFGKGGHWSDFKSLPAPSLCRTLSVLSVIST